MHELYELKEKLLNEMKKYSNKEMSASTLEAVDKMAHAVKNICKIIDDMEYSERGGSYMGGNYSGNYGGYSRDMNMGYSDARGRGRNARRDSMGRYSSANDLASELRELMQDVTDRETREDMQKLINKMERM